MRILTIGNSFTQDPVRYLHGIARADGVDLEIVNLVIGGCSLEHHYRNMLGETKAYNLEVNGHYTGFFVSIKEALLSREWDVITLQQASHFSFNKNTYVPYIFELVSYVKRFSPRAKIILQQTWAYEDGSERLHNVAGYETSEDMLSAVKKVYGEIFEEAGFDGMIRSGEMFGELLRRGIPKVHRDTFHASLGLGRYALGLLWYHSLTGRDVTNNSFSDFDTPISDEEKAIVKECVNSFPAIFNI